MGSRRPVDFAATSGCSRRPGFSSPAPAQEQEVHVVRRKTGADSREEGERSQSQRLLCLTHPSSFSIPNGHPPEPLKWVVQNRFTPASAEESTDAPISSSWSDSSHSKWEQCWPVWNDL